MVPLVGASPFLACDPYVPVDTETIIAVSIRYAPPGETAVTVDGTYTVSETYPNTIELLDLADYPIYIQNVSYFRARWQSSNGKWSEWTVSKGSIQTTTGKGTGSIAPGKGTGTISPYYDDILFIFYEEPNYMDLLFSPIYGIMNQINTMMR